MMKGLANVGDVLAGKYRVDKILGLGGMGMVVAATHLELEQQVALKFMLPAAMESPEASARFMREARAAGKLTSEHICRVMDVGRFESGAPYIVMEYLEGYDLGTMLKRRGPLRISSAVDYILQACEGLAEAHAQGIVHRDLKPDNLFLAARADGGHVIKVLDFGISKALVTGIATQTGDILGSPAYMAPEQMRSTKDVDARADIWSLGVVMYQLLTGRLPFTGDSLPTLCLSVLNEDPPPPTEQRHDLPAGLADVILRCLAKDLEDRYADVGALAGALGPFATPNGFGSVTRVRSALKGRQAPPDPSQTIPHGFAAEDPIAAQDAELPGGVAPTLLGTGEHLLNAGSDLFAPKPPGAAKATQPGKPANVPKVEEQVVGVTTLSSSSGESIEMSQPARRPFPIGLVGGLCGAIGLVVVLIVMVLRSGGSELGEVTTTPRTAVEPQEPPRGPSPTVTPIQEQAGAPSPGEPAPAPSNGEPAPAPSNGEPAPAPKDEPVVAQPGEPKDADAQRGASAGAGARQRPVRGKRPPRKGGKDGQKGGEDDAVIVTDDPTTPVDESDPDEDQWGRMQHDQPKKEEKAP